MLEYPALEDGDKWNGYKGTEVPLSLQLKMPHSCAVGYQLEKSVI